MASGLSVENFDLLLWVSCEPCSEQEAHCPESQHGCACVPVVSKAFGGLMGTVPVASPLHTGLTRLSLLLNPG